MKSERTFITVGFVLISLIWGSTWLAIKIGLDSIPPLTGIVFRFGLAIPILYTMMRWKGLRVPRDRDTRNLLFVVGFLSFGLPFGLIYWSAQYVSSGLMSILFAVYPFVIAIFSHLMLPSERLTPYKISGIILGFGGVVLIFSDGIHWEDQLALLGMLGVLASTVMQGASLILIKKHGSDLNPITLNFVSMFVGTLAVAVLALVFENGELIVFDAKGIGSIVYLGTLGTVVTFVTYFWLLKRVEVVYLSLVSFVTPVVAVMLGAIVLRESLAPNTFLGAALVLGGLLVANGKGLTTALSRNAKSDIR